MMLPNKAMEASLTLESLPVAIENHKQKYIPTPNPTTLPFQPSYERLGSVGHIALWVTFVVLLHTFIGFTYLSLRVPIHKRLYHILAIFLAVIPVIGYFAMASGDGILFVTDSAHVTYRQILWARYADSAFTSPLILLSIALLGGQSGANILITLVADELMVFLALFAALSDNDVQKWTYYVFSYLAYLVIVYQMAIVGRRAVAAKSKKTVWLYKAISSYALVLWALYGIIWALGTGARIVSVDTEIVGYAALDVFAITILGFWLLLTHGENAESIEGFWVHGLRSEGTLRLDEEL